MIELKGAFRGHEAPFDSLNAESAHGTATTFVEKP
jgi:hypothetical protein